jgi:hypothetical protein
MNIIEEIKTRLNRYPNARYEIETALLTGVCRKKSHGHRKKDK